MLLSSWYAILQAPEKLPRNSRNKKFTFPLDSLQHAATLACVSVKLLTVQEIASALGTHPETVRRWIRSGKLPAMKATKRTIRVRSDVIEELLRQNP